MSLTEERCGICGKVKSVSTNLLLQSAPGNTLLSPAYVSLGDWCQCSPVPLNITLNPGAMAAGWQGTGTIGMLPGKNIEQQLFDMTDLWMKAKEENAKLRVALARLGVVRRGQTMRRFVLDCRKHEEVPAVVLEGVLFASGSVALSAPNGNAQTFASLEVMHEWLMKTYAIIAAEPQWVDVAQEVTHAE